MNIGDGLYQINDSYLNPSEQTEGNAVNVGNVGKDLVSAQKSNSADAYQVELSPEVEYAKTRERLGLPPTGKLSMDDFQAAIDLDQENITTSLKSIMAKQSLPPNLKITLSVDKNGKIITGDTFKGKAALEQALNGDDAFVQSFQRLSGNHDILNSIAGSRTSLENMSLLTAIDTEGTQDDLFQIVQNYEVFRSTTNPLETLIQFGEKEDPYVFTYDPSETQSSQEVLMF